MEKTVRNAILLLIAVLAFLLIAGCRSASQSQEAPAGTEDAAAAALGEAEYAPLLFDTAVVHSIDIRVAEDAWNGIMASASESTKEYISCDMVIDGELVENSAIRCKGHSSLGRSKSTGKYSFKVEFDHFEAGNSYHGLDKLSLNNLVADSSCMHDYIVYRLMGEFGVASPLCSYVFVTVNGEDFGLYLAVEAVEDAFLERNFCPEHGALYKPDRTANRNANQNFRAGNGDTKLQYVDNDPDSYPNIFGTAKTDITRKDQYRLIESLRKLTAGEDLETAMDIDRVLRYFVIHSFVYNWDSYTGSSYHNYYLYEQDGLLSMIPWDYNESFGSGGAGVNYPIDTPVTSGTVEERPMLSWIFSDETYTAQYHVMYALFLDTFCDSGRAAEEIAAVRALIGPYVQRDPRSFYSYEQFETGADNLALYFDLRAQSVRGQLNGTIPSTAEGQAADSSARIDTSAFGGSASGEMRSSNRTNRTASGEAANRTSRRSASGESSGDASAGSSGVSSGETSSASSGEQE